METIMWLHAAKPGRSVVVHHRRGAYAAAFVAACGTTPLQITMLSSLRVILS
jgi:hypothetical protein